jgi:predicted MFS family arabinose efflux permease
MTTVAATADTSPDHKSISSGITFLLALSCGLIVANLYYAQPLVGPVSRELGLSPQAAGLVVTMTQMGYSIGLLLIVPISDLLENRRLVLIMMGLGCLAQLATAFATQPLQFLAAGAFAGLGSVSVQLLMLYAAHLAPEARRGRVVGNVSGGLMLGILLARPISSFITAISSWHVVFVFAALIMATLFVVLGRTLPQRQPTSRLRYGALLASMGRLLVTTPILQRRALYQASLFYAFCLFWTVIPLELAGPDFHLSQIGIGLFALAGVAGVIAAPIAGRIADRGLSRPATGVAIAAAPVAFLMTHVGPPGSALSLAFMVAAAILVDLGAQANVVLGFRAIFALGAEYRGRLNGLYMAIFYSAGAIGSALGAWAYAQGGWSLASWIGFAIPAAAFLYFLTEARGDNS